MKIEKVSPLYLTKPEGVKKQQYFHNLVLLIKTSLPPKTLLKFLLRVEKEFGRKRNGNKKISRTIDIDILCCENLIVNTKFLTLPHHSLKERISVLVPLCDISPESSHPELKIKYRELLNGNKVKGGVKRENVSFFSEF